MAWRGGRRGTGPVRLTQEVTRRAKQAHMHPHTYATFPMQTSVIRVKMQSEGDTERGLNSCMWPNKHSHARK